MNTSLLGKQAVVCGASRGIGRAAATELAALGAGVTLLARDAERLRTVQENLDRAAGQQHHALVVDFADTAALRAAIDAHTQQTGPIHILINNTGGPPAGPVQDATGEQFLAAFTQHLLGNHALAMALLPGMKQAGYGRIVNVVSTSVKWPIKGLGVSNTVRAAVANWAKTLAEEVARFGVTVNNVLPGATATDRLQEIIAGKTKRQGKTADEIIAAEQAAIPAGRFAEPAEIAAAIAFLASPAAAYITGINLPVDGGRTGCL
jgi:3-oxoacyl-[acyl-carrier protein] reductase